MKEIVDEILKEVGNGRVGWQADYKKNDEGGGEVGRQAQKNKK